jgi:C1A family cysteine protease
MKEAAKPFVMGSHTELNTVYGVKQYIGSGIGIVQIGIAWNNSMQPDSKGCIRSFRGGGGGHSVCYAGYVPDEDVGVKSSAGYWFLLLNSWGKRWGLEGWAYVEPKVVEAQLRDQFTVFIGRSELTTPAPRDIDWAKERVFG